MRYSKLRRTRRNVQKILCVNARLCCPCIICNYSFCRYILFAVTNFLLLHSSFTFAQDQHLTSRKTIWHTPGNNVARSFRTTNSIRK